MTCWAVVGDGSARRSFSSLSLLVLVVPCLWCACVSGLALESMWVREFFLPITHHDRRAAGATFGAPNGWSTQKGRTVARTE
jgi:hypothetical protein